MIKDSIIIRPRYGEVDKMGYVYHGNYVKYFHQARTEMMRKYSIDDDTLEKNNILLPVIDIKIQYLKPCYYDEDLKIETRIEDFPLTRLKFKFSVTNENNELVCKADSTVVFVDAGTRKPLRTPEIVSNALKRYFVEL